MKSRLFQFLVLALFALGAASAYGQLKIAVVNATQAVFESEEAQVEIKKIEEELVPEQDRLRELQDEMNGLRDRATKDAEIMSDEEKAELQRQIDDKQLDLQYGLDRLSRRANDERNRLFQELAPKFNAVLNDLIEIEGYDMVINWNPQVHLYVNPKHDITRKVTEQLNDRQGEVIPPTGETEETEDVEG